MAKTTIDDGKEEIMIPRAPKNDDQNFFVGVNGKSYILPRGKTSRVPHEVAEEIRRSWAAQETLDRHIDEMLEAANEKK